jgi:bifunctional oligoribonuclease and PAP phosphatase NrnA
MGEVPREVRDLVRSGRSFVLLAHLYPDGDVLGSVLGLGLALRGAARRVAFACPHRVPQPFEFLPGSGEVRQWTEGQGGYDVVVTLDCPDPSRVGGLLERCRQAGTVVLNIDHHADNRRYGDVNWIQPGASATGEMVFELLEEMGLPLTVDIAVNLYTAIVTDTGSFRYSNTTAQTLRIAARLLDAGVDPAAVANQLYEGRHLAGLHLLGRILQQVEASADGRIAWVVIDRGQMASPHLLEAEDVVTYPRSLRTALVAVLFRELPSEVKVSLRAKGEVNVARIAARLGGGGHANAAGAVVPGDITRVKSLVLDAVREALSRAP